MVEFAPFPAHQPDTGGGRGIGTVVANPPARSSGEQSQGGRGEPPSRLLSTRKEVTHVRPHATEESEDDGGCPGQAGVRPVAPPPPRVRFPVRPPLPRGTHGL